MKTRFYLLAKDVAHPHAKGHTTKVFFIGFVPQDRPGPTAGMQLTPMMGPPHMDGIRNAVMFPTQSLVQQALDELPSDFKQGLQVMDALVELV